MLFNSSKTRSARVVGPVLTVALMLVAAVGCSKKKETPRFVEAPPAFTLVRWCAVVDEETGRKLAALRNERIITEGYTGRSCPNSELMRLLGAAAGEKRVLHVGGIRQSDVQGPSGLRLAGDTWNSQGTITVNISREGQPGRQRKVLVQCQGEGDLQAAGRTEGASLSMNSRATADITDSQAGGAADGGKTLTGSIRYQGELPYDSSLVCLGRIGAVGGRNYDYVVVWQTTRSPEGLLEQVRAIREQSGQEVGGKRD